MIEFDVSKIKLYLIVKYKQFKIVFRIKHNNLYMTLQR